MTSAYGFPAYGKPQGKPALRMTSAYGFPYDPRMATLSKQKSGFYKKKTYGISR